MNGAAWPDGTPRSQGNAFDWRRRHSTILSDPMIRQANRINQQKLDGTLVGAANLEAARQKEKTNEH